MENACEAWDHLRRIVSIAIHVRIIHEQHVEHYVREKLKPSDPSVGTLVPNIKQKTAAELSLRQACSKIVHAKLFSLEKVKKESSLSIVLEAVDHPPLFFHQERRLESKYSRQRLYFCGV